jgi:ferredoxin
MAIADDLFDADDLGFAKVLPPDGVVPVGREDAAQLAASTCPERAIRIS